jgi:dipeptidyl aminopeptidase/acylaminoacyl peptidase
MAGMVPEDVYELTGAGDPRVSPDGGTVAYSVWRIDKDANEYRGSIWLAAVDGSTPPRQFTAGEKRDASPRWSPDGSLLVFTSKRGDEKTMQLYVMPVAGGEARKLTNCKEDVTDPRWSPDGRRIAFVSRVPDAAYEEEDDKKRKPRRFTRLKYKLDSVGWTADRPQHIFVVPADGSGEPVQLASGDFEEGAPAWSPDGSKIAFASARHPDWDIDPIQDIYVIAADGSGEPERVTSGDGACDNPAFSADGSRIAFHFYPAVFDDPKHVQIAVIGANGSDRRVLTASLDRNCGPYPSMREPIWESADRILFAIEDSGNTPLYRVPADGSAEPEPVVEGDFAVNGYDSANGVLVHSMSAPTSLSEVYAGDRRLTDVGRAFTEGRELPEPERFTAISPDGSEVEAWIMRPAGFQEGEKYPVLLNVHGGPFTQYGNRFFDEFQVYTGAGYVVVYSNPRGSSGYSEEWGRAIMGPTNGGPGWGSVDYEDCISVVDEAIKRFEFCDPDRLGVIGGSYGGFMTSWIVGHTDRFQAGVSERAVNQWVSMWGSSDFGWDVKGHFGSFVFEDVEGWLKISPHTYATQITTPLLILHSENDLRCPIEQGEQLFTTLRLLKREVEMVRFPNESHELTRSGNPVHRVMRFEIVLDWFDRYLKK